jgi:hypothetical protein
MQAAINNEVLVTICNKNYGYKGGMLDMWLDNLALAGVKNVLVVALDDTTRDTAVAKGFPAFRTEIEVRGRACGVVWGEA